MVKLLACRARGPGFDSMSCATISEIGYLLLPCRDMAERSLKRHKSSNQPSSFQNLTCSGHQNNEQLAVFNILTSFSYSQRKHHDARKYVFNFLDI